MNYRSCEGMMSLMRRDMMEFALWPAFESESRSLSAHWKLRKDCYALAFEEIHRDSMCRGL